MSIMATPDFFSGAYSWLQTGCRDGLTKGSFTGGESAADLASSLSQGWSVAKVSPVVISMMYVIASYLPVVCSTGYRRAAINIESRLYLRKFST